MTEVQKITVDIGAALATLQANPELAAQLNELAFGVLAADQLTAREGLIIQLGEALRHLATEAKLDGMDKRAGWDCWVSLADEALAAYSEFKES